MNDAGTLRKIIVKFSFIFTRLRKLTHTAVLLENNNRLQNGKHDHDSTILTDLVNILFQFEDTTCYA